MVRILGKGAEPARPEFPVLSCNADFSYDNTFPAENTKASLISSEFAGRPAGLKKHQDTGKADNGEEIHLF